MLPAYPTSVTGTRPTNHFKTKASTPVYFVLVYMCDMVVLCAVTLQLFCDPSVVLCAVTLQLFCDPSVVPCAVTLQLFCDPSVVPCAVTLPMVDDDSEHQNVGHTVAVKTHNNRM